PTEESLDAWFAAGVTCVGMGSKLISKEILANGDFEALEAAVRQSLDIIKKVKG
ncbi:MAG: bifunctional 4-hydroxy-2-oxoglutarate aldolase/2-dehydro-3-deoxy-phosphogluconate aldolase, partial [Flavobacteriia bacterium]